ncbi:beta-1,3-galactosyltransferase 2-like [Haliotis asinina]|uniref:beta-1,3-galactosyltransferase 2-like n=1 Tax=Haliotis asinina TaxID=109174 RepID=UPI0035320DCE
MKLIISIKLCVCSLIALSAYIVFTNVGLLGSVTETKVHQHCPSVKVDASHSRRPVPSTLYPATFETGFLLYDKEACSRAKSISLLYAVNSAPGHFKQRQLLRSAFANGRSFLPVTVKTVFLIGRATNTTVTRRIVSEFAEFKDIIQGTFLDDYRNLTLKITMGLKWISLYCRNVKLVGKIDDDVFVNTYRLLDMKHGIHTREPIHCDIANESVGKIHRGTSKWAVHGDVFKFYRHFPWIYCGGYAVFVLGELIPNLYKASLISPFIWIDDVYFTGIVVSRLINVEPHQGSFVRSDFLMQPKKGMECFRKRDCPVLATTVECDYIPEYWRLVQEAWKVVKTSSGVVHVL